MTTTIGRIARTTSLLIAGALAGGGMMLASSADAAPKPKVKITVKVPTGYVLTSSGRLVKVFGKDCFLLKYGEIQKGLPLDDGEWYCAR